MGKEITFQTKWDFRNASIGSILTYGLSATKQTHAMESKLQIFASKCLRSIDEKEEEDGVKGTIERNQEEGAGGKRNRERKKRKEENKKRQKGKGAWHIAETQNTNNHVVYRKWNSATYTDGQPRCQRHIWAIKKGN